jgi:putative salt-induced outer membrane protein YdiY
MNKIAIAVTGIFSLVGVASFAQAAAAAAEKPVGTRLNIGGSLTDGNTDTQALSADLLNDGSLGNGADYSIGIGYNYGKANDDKNADNAKAFAGARKILSDPVYGYVKADVLTDDIAGIDWRATVGPGIGTFLMKDAAAELGVELGVTWVSEEVSTVGTDDAPVLSVKDDYLALRVGQNYKRTISKTARAWQSVEWLPSFDDFSGNYLLNAEIGIESDISEGVALRLVAKDSFDKEPAAGREDNDVSLVAGLGIKL